MPQRSRDRSHDATKYPDERWRAACPQEHVPLLLRYDHHVVRVAGRPALLLTSRWMVESMTDDGGPLRFEISFTYAAGHPPAPASVQEIVDRLTFEPVDTSTPPG
jgi:hypothetical protein